MLKKVLSVVLALVLALSVVAVVASADMWYPLSFDLHDLLEKDPSAATVSDIEDLISVLPSEYNAQFYTEETEALIKEAKEAADAAFASGDASAIESAFALCQDAYNMTYETYEVPGDWYNMVLKKNHDESRAVADYYFDFREENDDGYLMPGETFEVDVSLKTNFAIRGIYSGFVFDKTVFEVVSREYNTEALQGKVDMSTNWELNTHFGFTYDGQFLEECFPEAYLNDEFIDQYGMVMQCNSEDIFGTEFFYPLEKTRIYTITMKVKDDAKEGDTGRIWVDNNFTAREDNFLIGSWMGYRDEDPLFKFIRAVDPMQNERVFCLEYEDLREACLYIDEQCNSCQTITFHNNDKTFTIGEAPAAPLDYTALEEAIASKANYKAFDYTEDSWKTFEDAVAAGEKEGLVAETQDEIDAYTKDIVDAREALVKYANDSEIISITEMSTPIVKQYLDLDVLVSKPVMKLQFVDTNGNTLTYSKYSDNTIGVEDLEDGTQLWHIKIMVYKLSEEYEVRVRNTDTGWSNKYYRYTISDDHNYNGNIISYAIADSYNNQRVKVGRHDLTVKTGLDITKLQLAYNGSTITYSKSSSAVKSVEEADGCLVWTIDFNFGIAGTGIVYDFNYRTAATSFTKSDVSMVVDVLH